MDPLETFAMLALRDGPVCYIDGLGPFDDDPLEIEHFRSKARGGSIDDPANLRLAHRSCNRRKATHAVVPKALRPEPG